MGSGPSTSTARPVAAHSAARRVAGQPISRGVVPAAAAGKVGDKAKDKGKGEGRKVSFSDKVEIMVKKEVETMSKKGKGKGSPATMWQIKLGGAWKDYGKQEDMLLRRAYMIGQKNVEFHFRGQSYEYNFKRMVQKNKVSKKERSIRPPHGLMPPSKPILPRGPMIILTVRDGQPGTMIPITDPNNPGQIIQVFVPKHAKAGQKLAVPIPGKGESVESVRARQEKHDAEHGPKFEWGTGAKVAAGGAAVAGVAAVGVGGVILGDHFAGGEMAGSIGEFSGDAVDAAGAWGPRDAAAASAWGFGAAGDVGDWFEGAGEDIVVFAGDAGDWIEDAAEDVGDFVIF